VSSICAAASSATRQHPSRHDEQDENNDDHENTEQPVRHGDHLAVRIRRRLVAGLVAANLLLLD
jgi:hypothetical protein